MNYYILASLAVVLHVVSFDLLAWLQLRTKVFTKILGSYDLLGYTIYVVTTGIVRDYLVHAAVQNDYLKLSVEIPYLDIIGWICFFIGTMLNIWVLMVLGWKGMYHGISFGYFLDSPVTGGPFALLENPQYFGATLNMLGCALKCRSIFGLFLTVLMWFTYDIAVRMFENWHFHEAYRMHIEKRKD